MDAIFDYTDAGNAQKIYFEDIAEEKRGGGVVTSPSYDLAPTTPLYRNDDGTYTGGRIYNTTEAFTLDEDMFFLIDGIKTIFQTTTDITETYKPGDYLLAKITYMGKTLKSVELIVVDVKFFNTVYVLTAKLADNTLTPYGFPAGTKVYALDTERVADALLGTWVFADKGDQPARIVLGGVVRKENAVDTGATLDGSIEYV